MQLMMQGSYMRPISTDEMTWSVSVCILSTPVSPAETDEPIEMPLGERPGDGIAPFTVVTCYALTTKTSSKHNALSW